MMRALGFLLLTIGFLVGALLAVQTSENSIPWAGFITAAIVSAVGVALARLGEKREAQEAIVSGGGLGDLQAALERLVGHMQQLDSEKAAEDPYRFHDRIDELFPDDINIFVDHRKRIAELHGLQPYAEVMNDFAAGERYLNRVWSASVDGYIDEVRIYIEKAKVQFERTRDAVARLEAK